MNNYEYSEEYMKGYERGLKDKLSPESFFEFINLNRLLNSTDQDARDRERGYKDALREKNHKKWEYISGYERGIKGKSTPRSAGEFFNPQKALFDDDKERKERERGFNAGHKEYKKITCFSSTARNNSCNHNYQAKTSYNTGASIFRFCLKTETV